MTSTLMTSTHVTYQMTVTVNVNVNADKALLLLIACVAFAIWKARDFFSEVALLAHDVTEAVVFTAMIGVIAFKAVAYGVVGVKL